MLTMALGSVLTTLAVSGPVPIVDPPVDWYDYVILPLLAIFVIAVGVWAYPGRNR